MIRNLKMQLRSKKIRSLVLLGLVPLGVVACGNQAIKQTPLMSQVTHLESASVIYAAADSELEKQAVSKIMVLQAKMDQATSKNLDVTREETLVWFAKEFLKYADWDEANQDSVLFGFDKYMPYKANKGSLVAHCYISNKEEKTKRNNQHDNLDHT